MLVMAVSAQMIVRVRTPDGCIRVSASPQTSWRDFKQSVRAELGIHDCDELVLSEDATGRQVVTAADTDHISAIPLAHGSMLYTLCQQSPKVDHSAEPALHLAPDAGQSRGPLSTSSSSARPLPVTCDHPKTMRCGQCLGRQPPSVPGAEAAFALCRDVFKVSL